MCWNRSQTLNLAVLNHKLLLMNGTERVQLLNCDEAPVELEMTVCRYWRVYTVVFHFDFYYLEGHAIELVEVVVAVVVFH